MVRDGPPSLFILFRKTLQPPVGGVEGVLRGVGDVGEVGDAGDLFQVGDGHQFLPGDGLADVHVRADEGDALDFVGRAVLQRLAGGCAAPARIQVKPERLDVEVVVSG